MEEWEIEPFGYNDKYGETNAYFLSLVAIYHPATRNTPQYGSIHLQILLVDNKTIIEHTTDISNRIVIMNEESKGDDKLVTE